MQIFAALDEVDVGGVDDQEVGGGVTEEEMFVGASDFLDVLEGDLGFFPGGFFGDAGAENLGLGLEVDDEIGSGNAGSESFVITVVEFELFVVEIEVGEDAVFFHEEVGEDGAGSFDEEGFAEALLALHEEIHLGAEGGAGLFLIEVGEEGIVFAVVDAAGVEALSQNFGEGGFADAERTFNHDEARCLRPPLRLRGAFGSGGIVGRHWGGIIAEEGKERFGLTSVAVQDCC